MSIFGRARKAWKSATARSMGVRGATVPSASERALGRRVRRVKRRPGRRPLDTPDD